MLQGAVKWLQGQESVASIQPRTQPFKFLLPTHFGDDAMIGDNVYYCSEASPH